MAETNSTEKTVVVTSAQHCRLWTLTIISLALNGIILILLVVGFICHHHRHHHHHGFGGGEGCFGMAGREGLGHGFHHFHGGFGGGDMMGNSEMMKDGFDGDRMEGHGMRHGGLGFGGGMMERDGERGQNGPPDPARITDKMLDHLSAKLTLTDDEKAKIKPIITAQVDQMQKNREAARQAHEKAVEDTRAKIKAFLTPDQQKLLDAMPKPGDQSKPPGE